MPRWRQAYHRRRFAVLLFLLTALLAGPPTLFGFDLPVSWFDWLISLAALAAVLSLCLDRRQRLFAVLLGAPTVLLSAGGHAAPGSPGVGMLFVGHACSVLFFLGAACAVVRVLFRDRDLTFDSVLGAVCGYLLLGLGWAVLYSMTEGLAPGSIKIGEALASGGEVPRPQPHVLTYYSFVTLTTVGYGDVTPVSPAARTFAWLEAVAGQFYLAVIVAGLVGLLTTEVRRTKSG